MVWARIPPDKLVNLPLFGIDVLKDDGDFVWMRGPTGRMRVHKRLPRVWFESVSDAHQAGAAAIMINSAGDHEALEAINGTRFEPDAEDVDPESTPS